jgi:hypothetical protein
MSAIRLEWRGALASLTGNFRSAPRLGTSRNRDEVAPQISTRAPKFNMDGEANDQDDVRRGPLAAWSSHFRLAAHLALMSYKVYKPPQGSGHHERRTTTWTRGTSDPACGTGASAAA